MGKTETKTTIALAGIGGEKLLESHGLDPKHFVFVANSNNAITTPFGDVGVRFETEERHGDPLRVVYLDCSKARALVSKAGRNNPINRLEVTREGIGSKMIRDIEIFVATTHFQS